VETVNDTASDLTDRASSSAEPYAEWQQERSAGGLIRAQDKLADLFEQQPLLLGALGIAIGAGIAASMPLSDIENRLAGDAADTVRDRAGELWSETKRRGTDLASKGLEEAEAQGLTPQAAADAARSAANRVAGFAERASRDIVDRVTR
jgi:hypothetical protein